MGSSTTLSIVLKLVDEASAAMAGVGATLKAQGDQLQSIGRTLTTDLTLPILGIGAATTKMANDFQASMMQLVTQAGLPADQLKNLSDQVLAFADSGAQQTPEILAQGLYHIVSLGVPAANAMNVLKLASEGAAMGGANLEDVANALGAAVASNIKGSGDYTNAMAVLNATVGAGNMRMGDLATSLGNVLPQATTAGLSLTDVGAAMATMTDNGMPAADAATRLHMAISLMEAPTGQAQKALASINMSQFQLADDMRNKGLLPALQDLHDSLVNSGKTADEQAAVLSAAFGGGRSAGAIELLLNNLDRVGQKYDLINQGVGTFGDKAADQATTAAAALDRMKASVAASGIEIGNNLVPLENDVFPKLAKAIKDVADAFDKLPNSAQNSILAILGILAVVGPITTVIGAVEKLSGIFLDNLLPALKATVTFVTDSFISVFKGIATTITETVIPALVTFFTETLPAFATAIWTEVIPAVGAWALETLIAIGPYLLLGAAIAVFAYLVYKYWNDIVSWTTTMMQGIGDAWNKGWTAISKFFSDIWDGIKQVAQDAMNFIMSIVNNVLGAINSVKNAASSIGGAIGNTVGGAFNNTIHAFAAGGIVNGPTLALVGEAGPEAIIPLSAFAGGSSLAGGGFGGGGGMVINVTGNNISSQLDIRNMAQQVGAELVRVLRLNGKYSI
jgi:TP901 family phage tail tape measure protein